MLERLLEYYDAGVISAEKWSWAKITAFLATVLFTSLFVAIFISDFLAIFVSIAWLISYLITPLLYERKNGVGRIEWSNDERIWVPRK